MKKNQLLAFFSLWAVVSFAQTQASRITKFFKGKNKEDLTLSKVVYLMGELDDKHKEEN